MGRRHPAGGASRHGRATRHRPLWRVRLVLLLWLAGNALRTVRRPTHHGSGRSADARPRCIHQSRERQARSRVTALEDDQLEWPDRRDYAEARQALLAFIRTQPARGWQLDQNRARSAGRDGGTAALSAAALSAFPMEDL